MCLPARAVPACCVPAGEGKLEIEDTFRLRLACGANINGSASALRTAPRPTAFPGTQAVSVQDTQYRGKTYPDSVRADDVVVFVSPGDVEDAAYSAGACAGSPDMRSSSRPGCRRFGQLAVRGYYMPGVVTKSRRRRLLVGTTAGLSRVAQSCCLHHGWAHECCVCSWVQGTASCL